MQRDIPSFVTKSHISSNGPPNRCFWCDAALGDKHTISCTVPQRTVVVRFVVDLVVPVPECWDKEHINRYFNESGWSLSDALDDVAERNGYLSIAAGYQGEATAADETEQQMFVRRLPA